MLLSYHPQKRWDMTYSIGARRLPCLHQVKRLFCIDSIDAQHRTISGRRVLTVLPSEQSQKHSFNETHLTRLIPYTREDVRGTSRTVFPTIALKIECLDLKLKMTEAKNYNINVNRSTLRTPKTYIILT
jgi:hypothetical protein